MIFFILSVLGVAFILYILLAGADFGAGILQLFKGERKILEQEKRQQNVSTVRLVHE